MFIANAVYTSAEFGETHLAISTDRKTGNMINTESPDGLYRVSYEVEIADSIMRAAAQQALPAPFRWNGVEYTLLRYTCNNEERFYNRYRKNHVRKKARIEKNTILYVYSERCRCTSCYSEYNFDSIENLCGEIPCAKDPSIRVEIDIQRCTRCNRYFVDEASLMAYEQRYGKLKIICYKITGNESNTWREEGDWYNPDSILSRHGYSTTLSPHKRIAVLVSMMENGVSKAEIKDTLTRFIYWRGKRCHNAVHVWRHDLEFVNDYELGSQPVINFVYD